MTNSNPILFEAKNRPVVSVHGQEGFPSPAHECLERFKAPGITTKRQTYTIVPLKLDFVAQKKGPWPSRPCGD